jgi:hypothetical protein
VGQHCGEVHAVTGNVRKRFAADGAVQGGSVTVTVKPLIQYEIAKFHRELLAAGDIARHKKRKELKYSVSNCTVDTVEIKLDPNEHPDYMPKTR